MNNDNLGTIINYLNYDANPLTHESILALEANRLNDETFVSIIIPVFNEGGVSDQSNIERTLKLLDMQTDLQGNKILNYEIIVVNNNSTDNSVKIIKDIIVDSKISIILIEEYIQGYENALKTGFDFAMRRFLQREVRHSSLLTSKTKFNKYTLAATDADPTDISQLWVYRIIEAMSDEMIACFGGPMPLSLDDAKKYPNINIAIVKYTDLMKRIWEVFGGHTSGANMGVRPFWYATVGGVKRIFDLPFAMDAYIGEKIIAMGGKAIMLPEDAFICFNLRRVLDNPVNWFAGKAYESGMTNIRSVNGDGDLPAEILQEIWNLRKRNTINLFFQLLIQKPIFLFQEELKLIPFFNDKSNFESFREKIIQLSGYPVFETKELISSIFANQVIENI
jgi:glycosyltransferase involved in cell wall biosynthesis